MAGRAAGGGRVKGLTERRIQVALYRQFSPDLLVPNVAVSGWEADLVRLTSSGLLHEFEIKVTRSDYRKDFAGKSVAKWVRRRALAERWERAPDLAPTPNRFWYVTPAGLLTVEELPDYAGLLEVVEDCRNDRGEAWYAVRTVKAAPVIHKQKRPEIAARLLTVLGHRYWMGREREDRAEYLRGFNKVEL